MTVKELAIVNIVSISTANRKNSERKFLWRLRKKWDSAPTKRAFGLWRSEQAAALLKTADQEIQNASNIRERIQRQRLEVPSAVVELKSWFFMRRQHICDLVNWMQRLCQSCLLKSDSAKNSARNKRPSCGTRSRSKKHSIILWL